MTRALQGPASAEAFRDWIKGVGRVYIDPLPSDHIAEETEDWWPSISAIKKAYSTDWTNVLIKRMAKLPKREWLRIADLGTEQRKSAMREVNSHDLSVAAGRGTIIHWWAEDLLNGDDPREITQIDCELEKIPEESLEIAEQYKNALYDFFEVYKPELVAAEYVTVHRTLNGRGYAGTPDALLSIKGPALNVRGVRATDYKTRDATSEYRPYPDEAAQVAAGVRGEYMIVGDGHGGAVRQRFPKLDGGLIVSIKPEGARLYPIDLDAGFRDFTEMHEKWLRDKEDRPKAIGRVWPVQRADKAALPTPLETAKERTAKAAQDFADLGIGAVAVQLEIETALLTATSVKELYRIHKEHKPHWNARLTQLAAGRKAELEATPSPF